MDTQSRIEHIKQLIDNGISVYDGSTSYECINANGQYLITFAGNNYCVGLFWRDGNGLNAADPFYFDEDGNKVYI